MLPQPQFLTVPGDTTLAYYRAGQGGQTIVFLHGLAVSSECWERNFTALSRHYTCIAIDLPGHGQSPPLPAGRTYTLKHMAESVLHLIGMLGLGRVALAGHSMGGQVALTAAMIAPGAIARLALMAPAGFEVFRPHERQLYYQSLEWAAWFGDDEQALRHSLATSFWQAGEAGSALTERLVQRFRMQKPAEYRRAVNGCIRAMLSEPVWDALPGLQCPTLICYGEHDALIPNRSLHPTTTRAIAQGGAARIPGSRLFMLRNAGHFVMWEKADAVNKLIAEHIGVPA